MLEYAKMIIVLSILSLISGGLLAFINNKYKEAIEVNELDFVKGPAIKTILSGSSNNPIEDRFKIMDGENERIIFVGKFDGKANSVVLESIGKGYGGDLGIVFGINITENKIVGVAVTTHTESPGLGANAKDDPTFVSQFKGLPAVGPFKVTTDGGQINAMTGATITSKAVCKAATDAAEAYKKLKPQIEEKLTDFAN